MLKNRLKLYQFGCAAICILILLVFVNKIIPAYSDMWGMVGDYSKSRKQFQDNRNWKEKTVKLKRDVQRFKSKILSTTTKIPAKDQISIPLSRLDSLSRINHTTMAEFSITSIDSTKQYQTVNAKTLITGEYNNIKQFIKQVEVSDLPININMINIKLQSLYRRRLEATLAIEIIFRQN